MFELKLARHPEIIRSKGHVYTLLVHCDEQCDKIHEVPFNAESEKEARGLAIAQGLVPTTLSAEELIEVQKQYPWYKKER